MLFNPTSSARRRSRQGLSLKLQDKKSPSHRWGENILQKSMFFSKNRIKTRKSAGFY